LYGRVAEKTLEESEREIRALLDAGQHDDATTLTVKLYGPELLGFLKVRLRDLDHARDAFAWMTEDLWRGMPRFRGQSSVRTWAYAIARNAAYRYADRELRERYQGVPISQVSRASALAVQLPRGTNLDHKVARLRAQLSDEEQTVLTLRVDKGMDFREIAVVMLYQGDEAAAADAEAIEREAARLRKRFQLLKDKLRKLAAAEDERE
jgi:RNA polymerase sigma-70 factor (ECF subfamily)